VSLDTPIGVIPIPFASKGEMPVIRVPEITSLDVNFKSLGVTGIDAVIKIGLKNPNVFKLDIGKLDYALKLEKHDFASGSFEKQLIEAKSAGTLKVPVKLDFASVGSWLVTLVDKGSASYTLSYDAVYDILDGPVKQKEKIEGKVEF
jgi:LEA14-like dessication related protein